MTKRECWLLHHENVVINIVSFKDCCINFQTYTNPVLETLHLIHHKERMLAIVSANNHAYCVILRASIINLHEP